MWMLRLNSQQSCLCCVGSSATACHQQAQAQVTPGQGASVQASSWVALASVWLPWLQQVTNAEGHVGVPVQTNEEESYPCTGKRNPGTQMKSSNPQILNPQSSNPPQILNVVPSIVMICLLPCRVVGPACILMFSNRCTSRFIAPTCVLRKPLFHLYICTPLHSASR